MTKKKRIKAKKTKMTVSEMMPPAPGVMPPPPMSEAPVDSIMSEMPSEGSSEDTGSSGSETSSTP